MPEDPEVMAQLSVRMELTFAEMGAGDNVVQVDTHGCIGQTSGLRHRPKRRNLDVDG